jgi:hypothetical protein
MKNKKWALIIIAAIAGTATGYIYLNLLEDPDDKALFQWVTTGQEYTYYKNSEAILPTSEETERAHDNFMRVRFNKIASSVLDTGGKLPEGTTFPDSSIIVKEIYSDKNNTAPDILAIMAKLKGDKNAGKDWLWAEYTPSGETEYSVIKKGKICIKCHTPGDDFVRIFDIVK